ncbi:tetratricopeptide repeat protein [Streptomyces fulvoviolaceus]|uniref:tetratricopeptide repeat protein n=1 Tax=Streptomyces fulvoviolaceus TaxID=285535 RepID=UPI003B830F23
MNTTYYDHGTPAERWERAQLFFDAKDYTAAARVLGGLVEEVPEQTGPRLLLARAYYHSAQLHRAETELRIIVERDPVEQYATATRGAGAPAPRRAGAGAMLSYFDPASTVSFRPPRRWAISPRTTSATMNPASGMPSSGTK